MAGGVSIIFLRSHTPDSLYLNFNKFQNRSKVHLIHEHVHVINDTSSFGSTLILAQTARGCQCTFYTNWQIYSNEYNVVIRLTPPDSHVNIRVFDSKSLLCSLFQTLLKHSTSTLIAETLTIR